MPREKRAEGKGKKSSKNDAKVKNRETYRKPAHNVSESEDDEVVPLKEVPAKKDHKKVDHADKM